MSKRLAKESVALPETIPLKESQRVSLDALGNILRQYNQQAAQLNAAIEDTQAKRARVLGEIESEHGIEPGTIATIYQYDGQQLIRAS